MYTITDLRTLKVTDLRTELAHARAELYERQLKVRMGQEQTHHHIRATKKYIARILTIMAGKDETESAAVRP